MTRIAVLSDLHIAPPGPLVSFHAGEELAALLGRLRSKHQVTTLVLAGDILDFLAMPGATGTMQPAEVPATLSRAMAEIKAVEWGARIFNTLGVLAREGVQILVLPGNHDPELAHPDAGSILRAGCGLSAEDKRLEIYVGPGPWHGKVGDQDVVIGHGHRGDPWNDIDSTEVLHHATMSPPLPLELPLGSRLVVGAMRAFREQYPFIDALKPEVGVFLLLAYLDPRRAVQHFPGVARLGIKSLIASLQRRLDKGPVLSDLPPSVSPTSPEPLDELSTAIFASMMPAERTAGSIVMIEDWLAGHDIPAAGALANHGGAKFLLRAALACLDDGGLFDQSHRSKADQKIIDAYLAPGQGSRIVIAGHTHAARYVRIDDKRTYVNTGTWTNLIPWPRLATDAAAKAFIDDLERQDIVPGRRLTWALIDEQGAQLLEEESR
jgi:UDP-2,3-diacylglucosamine pyrophosphatase LpxH